MKLQFSVHYNVIPDGVDSIVRFEIRTAFLIASENAPKQAESVAVEIMQRLSGLPERAVREVIQENLWLGKGDRPEEPTP